MKITDIIQNTENLYEGNLIHYFNVIWNSSGTYNPYHGFRHVNHVMFSCYDAIKFYRNEISKTEARQLLIAAILHDLDHSGTKKDDSIQVNQAIESFNKNIDEKDKIYQQEIEEIIRATQYPYIIETEKLPLLQQIIRDADMTQTFSEAWIQQIIFGLGKEWGYRPTEMLERQKTMLEGFKWHTKWAEERYGQNAINAKLKEVLELLKIVKSPK